jgi:hypothetical protein
MCHRLLVDAGETADYCGDTITFFYVGAVTLNPERDSVILEHATEHHIQQLAA